jgi:hypothetical protein
MSSRSFSSIENYNRHWKTKSNADVVKEMSASEDLKS